MRIKVIGGGLAGCEAAYRLASDGYDVALYEMRGKVNTPCHSTDSLAELVCSNSLKSVSDDTASGMLKKELEMLGSMMLQCAYETAVPAGGALAVDRIAFSRAVEERIGSMSNIEIIRQEVKEIDFTEPTIIATGPLTSAALHEDMSLRFGCALHFYDAVAPIVDAASIDYDKAYFGARYDRGDADYLNCPMNKEEYLQFYRALIGADRVKLHSFESDEIFEGCMPVEVMASRGEDTLRFGPLRPVGLRTPDGGKPYAVVQLRKENLAGDAYNIVGFQTNLTFGEQKRVFGMIPALKDAEYLRYGVMHRNTYINAPDVLASDFSLKEAPLVFVVGQLSGVEGYVESIASGLIGAINMSAKLSGRSAVVPPPTTITGALCNHVSTRSGNYQPMNANFGILPPLADKVRDKKERKRAYTLRGIADLSACLKDMNL
ncbi:MAG: methylenetetrahydrofolate--tRNA-(uracil(54)-C(5))-methyltransferase (FADH(2)-oxidizing) TrmFO [Clostridia bacterium]|nr:methylenetetrahydrofolate--tRNA-(uracil(54)-C(5))-methyltransferase (FADH(2)-oxidizing) TrmFO [Clostridia bacterium]